MRILLLLLIANFHTASAQVFQSSYIKPKKIIEKAKGHYFIDFGKDAFGTLSLLLKSPQQDSLVIHLGEKLSGRYSIDKDPGGTIRYQRVVVHKLPAGHRYNIQLIRNKRNTSPPAVALPDSFGVIMPFRYAEIENLQVPLSHVSFTQKVFNYHFNDNASYFTSSDTILNKIWDLCKHTIKATSFCGLYVDGDRERIPYEADALINQLSHYAVDNEYSLARRTNEYFIDHPTWPTEWVLHTVLLFYYDYLYTGDTAPVSKHYEALKNKTLVSLERADGLISSKSMQPKIRDIIDWPENERDGYEMVEVNTVVNAFHYINLKLMAKLAGALNKKEDSILFHNKSVLVKNSINQKFLKGIYTDGEGSTHSSLHANMF
ncbi:MAG TPA: alpha-L-rhamnosidase, partial [Chitinophagaceae bacterium]|nr:alpha-L-rhamnosidase [Chitinophagaceae bacterium]